MITTFHGFTCIVFVIFWNEEQSEMTSFPYKPFSQYFHIIIQKMKETKEFEIIQREADVPTNIFSSQFKKPEIDEILGNQADKTAASTAPESGQWRSNEMLQCSPIHQAERALGLRHLTSFEEKSMEDHGKILKRTLENYLKIYNIRLVDEEQFEGEMEQKFTNWDQVQVGLTSLQNFEQKKLNSLLKFSRRNLEAQLVLRLIFCNIPEQFLPESLLITDEVFQEYQRSNIQVKDEDQIETYVSLNYCNLSQKIKIELQQSDILPRDAEGEYKFEEMIGVWMETVFLALNGVFENPESRKTPLCSLQGFETFYESRKLIKFD